MDSTSKMSFRHLRKDKKVHHLLLLLRWISGFSLVAEI
jgi:hypothetical protein